MDLGIKGKVVLITGSGSGIGQAMAVRFAMEGATVVVNDLTIERCQETARQAAEQGGRVELCPFDVTRLEQVQAAAGGLVERLGAVDVLVNNAAVLLANQLYLETAPDDCDREIQAALYGTLHCVRAFAPGMVARSAGRIINMLSDAGRLGQEREASYSAAKGGVIAFTRSMARELGRHGITVNAISPAATDTPLRRAMLRGMAEKMGEEAVLERERKIARAYPMRRIGTVEDVAQAAIFLSSNAAAYITGQVLGVNGGYAMV